MTDSPRTRITALLAEGHTPDDIAAALVDEDVSSGEYEGCSSELEMAYTEYESLAWELLDDEVITPKLSAQRRARAAGLHNTRLHEGGR